MECNSLSCTCTDILYPNDDNDVNDCDSLISEAYSDESCNIIFGAQPSTELLIIQCVIPIMIVTQFHQ